MVGDSAAEHPRRIAYENVARGCGSHVDRVVVDADLRDDAKSGTTVKQAGVKRNRLRDEHPLGPAQRGRDGRGIFRGARGQLDEIERLA